MDSAFQQMIIEIISLGVEDGPRFAISEIEHRAGALVKIAAEVFGCAPKLRHIDRWIAIFLCGTNYAI